MHADELYDLPLDRFVAERGALAKALRGEGRGEEAAEVAKRRKPSVAAWAVNQLVRTQRGAVTELFAAGDGLRTAQAELLAGGGNAHAMRAASERERAAVEGLLDAARDLLSSDGHQLSATIIERVAETLHAAALDDEARASVERGCLEHELRHVGLGAIPAGVRAPAPRRRRETPPPKCERPPKLERELEREREHTREAARIAVSDAKRRADRAARALTSAEERRERAAAALREADSQLTSARAESDAAADAHRRAREDLDAPG